MARDEEHRIRVAIVEDDLPFRRMLRMLVEQASRMSWVGEWARIETAVADSARATAPDVLLLDIDLPGMSGDLGVSAILECWPTTNVLMLTASSAEEKIFNSLCRGAKGYLLKGMRPDHLLDAIADAAEGFSPMSPAIARSVVAALQRQGAAEAPERPLTPREGEVLALLARGHTYDLVAVDLAISVNTVRNYIRSIYEKLHVHSCSEAVAKAMRARLI